MPSNGMMVCFDSGEAFGSGEAFRSGETIDPGLVATSLFRARGSAFMMKKSAEIPIHSLCD